MIRLPRTPVLDQQINVGVDVLAALLTWQARPGEIFTVVDPDQIEYRARLTSLSGDGASLLPFTRLTGTESPVEIALYQALPEKERFELVLQKATELGVTRVAPFTCQRSTTLAQRDAGQKKSHRWPDVLLRAARQCRRALIPELLPVLSWEQMLAAASSAELALFCYESANSQSFAQALHNTESRRIAIVIGPEGGFSGSEAQQARQTGILPVGLGTRILRTETAAILATGLIQFALGDIGLRNS